MRNSGSMATSVPTAVRFDRDAWEHDGFLVSRRVLDPSDLDACRAEADRLVTAIEGDRERYATGRYIPLEGEREGYEVAPRSAEGSRRLRMIEPLVDLSPVFRDLAFRDDVAGPARAVLEDEVLLFEDKLNLKPPGGAGFVWHQDWSCCWRAHTDRLVTCFIYLDDSTQENGCLEVLPGSHAGRLVRPFVQGSEFEVVVSDEERAQAVALPLSAGDMIAFDPYLLHFSAPNASRAPRRAILYTYSPAELGDLWSIRYPELAERSPARPLA